MCISLDIGKEVTSHLPMSHVVLPLSLMPTMLAIDRYIYSMPLVVAKSSNKFQILVICAGGISKSVRFSTLAHFANVVTIKGPDSNSFNLP